MQDTETLQLLRVCREEIVALRRQVDELMPRAEAFESIRQVLGMIPRASGGFSPDILWLLNKRIEEVQADSGKPEPQFVREDEGGGQ